LFSISSPRLRVPPSLRSLQEPALSAVEGVGTTDAYRLGFCAMNSRPCCTNLMVSAASCPPLPKNARAGHPPCLRCSQNQRLGHPPAANSRCRRLIPAVLALLLIALLVSCRGGGANGGGGSGSDGGGNQETPPGTYSVSVTVAINGITQSINNLDFVVQ